MSKKNILSVKKLNKIYRGNIHALKDLNLEVKEGEILGLLGPNGAGKSTFINILAGVTDKTSGEVIVWGFNLDKNPRQVRVSLGIVPQEINVDPFFTPKKLLDLQAGLFGVKKKDRITDTILDLVALKDKSNSYTRSLSGGMKRRLLIAKALVHKPPIVILDEPTAGVDVELRRNLWENIRSLRKLGVTIILTTHYLQEAEELCDRVGIIHKGSLIALDTTENMLNKIQTKTIKFEINKRIVLDDRNKEGYNILTNTESEFKIEYNKQDFIAAEGSAKILLLNKPNKKIYYIQLSAIYNVLEKYDLSLATMEVSYMKGMLEKPEEFTNLASFYLYRKNPVMSARVLENAISDENIIFTKANAKLLADSWLYAKERNRSLEVLTDSLKTNPDDHKLAKQYVDIAFSAFQWREVISGIDRIEKLNIKDDGKYQLMQGIAYFELKQYANAKNSFVKASISKKYKDSGAAWIEYLEALTG